MIRERYKISYGLQYDVWELELRLPDWEEYGTEREARKKIGDRTVSALLTADAIFYSAAGWKCGFLRNSRRSTGFRS